MAKREYSFYPGCSSQKGASSSNYMTSVQTMCEELDIQLNEIPDYEKKVQCCGGALAFSEPEKSQEMVKGILESAYDHGADKIVTPCPVCQMNVEVYQDDINATYGTKFNMPVVYYSTLMSVAYGRSARNAALEAQIIPAKKLDKIARK